MFRLIQLHARHGIPRIGVDPDGYASERAALVRYRETPATFFAWAGSTSRAGSPRSSWTPTAGRWATAPARQRGARRDVPALCDTCAFGLEVLTVAELSNRLGVAVRLAPVLARSGRHAAPEDGYHAETGSPASSPHT